MHVGADIFRVCMGITCMSGPEFSGFVSVLNACLCRYFQDLYLYNMHACRDRNLQKLYWYFSMSGPSVSVF